MSRAARVAGVRWGLFAAAVVAVIGLAPEGRAQEPVLVELTFEAASSVDTEKMKALSGLRLGDPYRPLEVRRAVRRLYRVGKFDNVYVRAAFRADGGVALTIQLPPRRIIRNVTVSSEVLTRSEALAVMNIGSGTDFDERAVISWAKALRASLLDRGYRDAVVDINHRAVDDSGAVDVDVRVTDGPVTRLSKVIIQGRPRRPLWRLDEIIDIEPGDILTGPQMNQAVEGLVAYYRSEGHLDAKVVREAVVPATAGRDGKPRADVVLEVTAGPKVTVRFRGHRSVGTQALQDDAELLATLGTGPAALAEVRERIVSRYQQRGFWKVRVSIATRVTADEDKKEILFSILENDRAQVWQLRFEGNDLFDEALLRDTVVAAVRDALGSADGQPGVNPATADNIVGGKRDGWRQPDLTAPDPRRVYIPSAYRAAQTALADLFRAEGYQTVEVDPPTVDAWEGNKDLLDIMFRIRPGIQWRVPRVVFVGNEERPSSELLKTTGMDPSQKGGQPLSFSDVEAARQRIIKHYRDQGFLYVELSEHLVPATDLIPEDFVGTSSASMQQVRRHCLDAQTAGEDTCDVALVFKVNEGQKVITGNIIITGLDRTGIGIVRSEVTLTSLSVLRASEMEQTRDNLLRLGVFDIVEVGPFDPDVQQREKDVLIELKERDPYWLELGIGASTEDGLRGSVAFGDGNLFGSALRLQLQARLNIWLPSLLVLYNEPLREPIENFYGQFGTLGRLEYEVAAGLSYPRIPGLPRGFSTGLDVVALRDFDPAFLENTQTVTLLSTYKYPDRSRRYPSAQVRLNYERTALDCNNSIRRAPVQQADALNRLALLCGADLIVATGDGVTDLPPETFGGNNEYVTTGPRFIWDLRDNSLDPKSGAYFETEALYSVGIDPDSPDFVTVNFRANFYARLLPRLVLAVSGLGSRLIQTTQSDLQIPLNRRLFAGGRTTIRGYAEKTLLPQDTEIDANGIPLAPISTGGQTLAALKSELRLLIFPSVALSAFVDVGDLWISGIRFRTRQTIDVLDTMDQPTGMTETIERSLAVGAGAGVRLATPIGPLSIDFAIPVNRRDPGASGVQYHFAVGSF